jgi:hypothetical protein
MSFRILILAVCQGNLIAATISEAKGSGTAFSCGDHRIGTGGEFGHKKITRSYDRYQTDAKCYGKVVKY